MNKCNRAREVGTENMAQAEDIKQVNKVNMGFKTAFILQATFFLNASLDV